MTDSILSARRFKGAKRSGCPGMRRHPDESRLREEQDSELAEALKIALDMYGRKHPLVDAALKELRAKERKASPVGHDVPDEIQRIVFAESVNDGRVREPILADRLLWLLDEAPMREVRLEGMGRCLVDFYFPEHKLVVEEDGHCHYHMDTTEREALLRRVCERLGLKLMHIGPTEAISLNRLTVRLERLGIAFDHE